MSLKSQILSFLNRGTDFCEQASEYFKEEKAHTEEGVNIIIDIIIKGLSSQNLKPGKSEEIRNMAKESGNILFTSNLNNYYLNETLMAKGGAFIAEIFGEKFNIIVNEISNICSLKATTINKIFGLLASMILNVLNRIFRLSYKEGSNVFDWILDESAQKVNLPESLETIFPSPIKINKEKTLTVVVNNKDRKVNKEKRPMKPWMVLTRLSRTNKPTPDSVVP